MPSSTSPSSPKKKSARRAGTAATTHLLDNNFMASLVIDGMIAPVFLLMGLSHVMQPRLWTRFFERLKQTGLAAVIIPLYTLPFGLLLIATHTAWPLDWSLVYTIAGWMMTLKSTIYLLVP